MRLPCHRRVLVLVLVFALLFLVMVSLPLIPDSASAKAPEWHVDPAHKKLVHDHVLRVLQTPCRSRGTRRSLESRLSPSSLHTQPFLWRDQPLPDDLFLYPPPFGFKGHRAKVEELLQKLPDRQEVTSDQCRRCVVVGNGGILRGLELGELIDRFHTVIRLNSGPLGEFVADVGNRTSVRMSYPEGTALRWTDTDPHTLFVAVVHKGVDIGWISAMISRLPVRLWDRLFFWQKVPDQIPVEPNRFRLLNPGVIRETALDLLHYNPPRNRWWGSDPNVPTVGVSALTLASLLCDEVSLAGFGYDLSPGGGSAPLHYYDRLPMAAMLKETSHNVDQETRLLQDLLRGGAVSDLTGGIHCSFCPS